MENGINVLTVYDVAEITGKSPETIKRWIREDNMFPNAYKENDKKGWRIPESDLEQIHFRYCNKKNLIPHYDGDFAKPSFNKIEEFSSEGVKEVVILAFQAVTMTTPTKEVIDTLCIVGIRRTMEILLTMQQSPTKVKSQLGFIKAAIKNNWSPETIPVKMKIKKARILKEKVEDYSQPFPFYNWLEE